MAVGGKLPLHITIGKYCTSSSLLQLPTLCKISGLTSMFLDLFSYKWTKMIEMRLIEGQKQKVQHIAINLLCSCYNGKEENPENGQRPIKALYKECIALSECRALWDRKCIYSNP